MFKKFPRNKLIISSLKICRVFIVCLCSLNFVWAAGETPHFFTELAALIIASAVIAYLSLLVGLIPIVGFLIAGVIIGPNALGLVQDKELIDAAAEIGVVILLFTIGIEFSLETLARISRLIFVGGGLQVGGTTLVVTLLLLPFGVSWQAAVFTGCLVALSSTTIVMKLLADRAETNTASGQASLGILIFQDLAVVAMVLVIPLLGEGSGSTLGLFWALLKAGGIIAAVLILARKGMPRVLEAVARTCSPEIFLLTIIAICFGTAYLTSLVGVSLSLGAFLAGLLVSESRFGQQALSEILPLQILFSAAFFVSVGLLLDLKFLMTNLPLVLAVILAVVLIKVIITALSVKALNYPLGVAAAASLLLSQIGEFSFVLERSGQSVGLSPVGLGEQGSQTFVACTVILMGITPFLADLGRRLELKLNKKMLPKSPAKDEIPQVLEENFATLNDHIIIAGYGLGAQKLATILDEADLPYVIATLSPTGASEAESKDRKVVRGDYSKNHILELMGIKRARMLVIPDDQPAMAHRVTSVARATSLGLTIITCTPYQAAAHELKEAGASVVVSAEHAALKLVTVDVLSHFEVEPNSIDKYLEELSEAPAGVAGKNMLYLSKDQISSKNCQHTNMVTAVKAPKDLVCPECIESNDNWVHLRICMTCGHVGCCDSSKNKHARKHYQTTGHSIIKSLEKGESWAWCFVEKAELS